MELIGLVVFPSTLQDGRTFKYGARVNIFPSVNVCNGGTSVVLLPCVSLVKLEALLCSSRHCRAREHLSMMQIFVLV